MNGRHSPSMSWRLFHIGLSCFLSVAALAIGGYLSKTDSASFFNLGNLFGHGLFVALVFPAYCVFFYWSTYPFFRVPALSVPPQQGGLAGDNSWISGAFSLISVVFSLGGFLIPPVALAGIISDHLARIRLRATGAPNRGRLALTGLILGHISLGFWVSLFLWGFLGFFN